MTLVRERHRRLCAALLAGVLGVPVGGTVAHAEPPASQRAAVTGGAGSPATTSVEPGTKPIRITLVTGDVVTYAVAHGRATATATPGNGSGTTSFRSHDGPDGFFVVPESAERWVAAGVVDRALFDVRYLAEHGYGDDATASIPVIASYQRGARAAGTAGADPLPATRAQYLPSAHGSGLTVAKSGAGKFWRELTGEEPTSATKGAGLTPATTRLGHGVTRLSLDRKVSVALDVSVPMIGAPAAWAAGYDGSGVRVAVLDTGVDQSHPDLAGRIAATANFSSDPSVADGHGHGTHVASTIAGSGAASAGRYRGVAPGASLLVGKVLGNDGFGMESDIIAGMEWAVQQHADVVSMSIGSDVPSDGSDNLSQAVDELTAQSGTLFVIAAGNSGPEHRTIGSPGSAAAALTVGAVDRAGRMPSFSSRGPRLDNRLKPEISAPGVGIVAARAAGTGLGAPVDDHYTALSGTSMATPHVAGAAALLAQAHQDWTATRLKSVLVSTSRDNGHSVWDQGAGMVDVARAVRQNLSVSPTVLAPGATEPEAPAQTHEVTYTNPGDTAVTLDLSARMRDLVDAEIPGAISLDQTSVTVPAGGTATVHVTLDPKAGPAGLQEGAVVATTAAGDRLTVPVGLYAGPKMQPVTTLVRLRANSAQALMSLLNLVRVDDGGSALPWEATALDWQNTDDPMVKKVTMSVPEGVYSVEGVLQWTDLTTMTGQYAAPIMPEVRVDGPTTVDLDLNRLVPVEIDTPRASQPFTAMLGFTRTSERGITRATFMTKDYGFGAMWTLPVDTTPKFGTFKVMHHWELAEPQATLRLNGRGAPLTLHPYYHSDFNTIGEPKFDRATQPTLATMADVRVGRNVRGALVYTNPGTEPATDDIAAATRAGAAGVLTTTPVYDDAGRTIPVLWVPRDTAGLIEPLLARGGTVRADLTAQLESEYQYSLWYFEPDRVPAQLHYRVDERDLSAVTTRYHSTYAPPVTDVPDMGQADFAFRLDDRVGMLQSRRFTGPTERLEYYNRTAANVAWWRQREFRYPAPDGATDYRAADSIGTFQARRSGTEDWNNSAVITGQSHYETAIPAGLGLPRACFVCVEEGRLYVLPSTMEANDSTHTNTFPWSLERLAVSRNGTELPMEPGLAGLPSYPLGAEGDHYQVDLALKDQNPLKRYGTGVSTSWQFALAAQDRTPLSYPYGCIGLFLGLPTTCGWQPLLELGYDLPLSIADTAAADSKYEFTVTPTHAQPTGGAPIAGVRVWTSYDDGRTWVEATVRPARNGAYTVQVRHPALARTSGAVSIRTEAWDTAGGRVEQTLDRAYGLTTR